MHAFTPSDFEIIKVRAWEIDIPLRDEFVISRGSVTTAQSVFVRVELRGGAVGFGECAPFGAVTGEDRATSLRTLNDLRDIVIGQTAFRLRPISRQLGEAAPDHPAARCGLETAILDALCRAAGIPTWEYFGNVTRQDYETDITLPILGVDRCLARAREWYRQGFRTLKVKVGIDLDADLATIERIAAELADISFVIDANQGFSESDALSLIRSLERAKIDVRLLEQPLHKDDLEGMARLRREASFDLCADESVDSVRDVALIARTGAADVVNIKIMKSGVYEAFEMAVTALASGLGIMFGGMIETRLAMGCSLAMAAGLGGAHTLDLDTPLLMATDPLDGGYRYEGPRMHLWTAPGLGTIPRNVSESQ
ncbi:MAG TPA: dipeptide epimerase [Acidobacteriota bacterium]|nr:dipeptide epimerase [Acidobacteriota bacterium]